MSFRRTPLLGAVTAALTLTLAVPGAASAASCANTGVMPGTAEFTASAETATLCLLNNERAAAGIAPLREGPAELKAPAVAFAHDMVDRGFFAHETPDGIKLLTRLVNYAVGAFWTVGENLAWGEHDRGTPDAIVRAWMNSPGHRRNILDGSFKEIGIGIVPGAPQPVTRAAATYVTEFGARSLSQGSAPSPTPRPGGSGTAAKRSTAPKSTKGKARCRRVIKKVRRNGRTVRVKKLVCPKKKATRSTKRR